MATTSESQSLLDPNVGSSVEPVIAVVALAEKPGLLRLPRATLVIPCRNEEKRIRKCLDSILAGDYPISQMEILIVDAMSEDRTRQILAEYQEKLPGNIRVVDNPQRLIPIAMNIGLREARGEIILKIDAHSAYPRDYVSGCVASLLQSGAENAGGVWRILPGDESATAKAIARTLAHPFSSGNARVKLGAREPIWADSAAFGCWRKRFLEKIGGWNEKLAGSSDMDLNARLKQAGGRILLDPSIQVEYYADSNLASFWKHNFADGVWSTYVLKFRSKAWAWRHWAPMALLLMLLLSAGFGFLFPVLWIVFGLVAAIYLLANAASSVQIAVREKDPRLGLASPMAFAIRHFAHGIGALYGVLLVLLPGEHWKGRRGANK